MDKGLFIVLEGSDGAGKATQLNLLRARLEAAGYDVAEFDFPRYGEPSSYFVKQYLEGNFGPSAEVSPYTASLFYALDRYEAAPQIRQALSDGKIVLSNRYVGSNMAHQGSKFESDAEQRGFFLWADSLEFQLMGIPRPNLNLLLRLSVETSMALVEKRATESGRKLDEHEKDAEHLKKSFVTYDLLCQLFPKDFQAIECAPSGHLQSVTEISNKVWAIIKPLLPPPHRAGQATTVNLSNPSKEPPKDKGVKKRSGESTESRHFNERIKLSLDNVSLLLLEQLQEVPELEIDQQLVWPKTQGDSGFLEPTGLSKSLKAKYVGNMRKLISNYKTLEKQLQAVSKQSRGDFSAQEFQAALAPIIPVAAYSHAVVEANTKGLQILITKLMFSELPEAKELLAHIKSSIGGEDLDKSGFNDSTQPLHKALKQFYEKKLPTSLPPSSEDWILADASPRNEFELLLNSIYPYTDRSYDEIQGELDSWPYEQKLEALQLSSKQLGSFLNQAQYRFDVVTDRVFLDKLMDLGVAQDLQLQALSPRLGYKMPKVIEELGLEEVFLDCFDSSLELYSQLQAAGLDKIAAYACLKGHKGRLQLTLSAGAVKDCLQQRSLDDSQTLILSRFIDKIKECHPVIGEYLQKLEAQPPSSPKAGASPKRHRGSRRRRSSSRRN